jgi:hypothetical protein
VAVLCGWAVVAIICTISVQSTGSSGPWFAALTRCELPREKHIVHGLVLMQCNSQCNLALYLSMPYDAIKE